MEKGFKVVGVISSANRNGNTAALVREALKGAEERGAEVREIFLADSSLNFCTGCMRCSAQGKCPLKDDFEQLRSIVYEADGLIFGSPTYGATFNACLKGFLERLGTYTLFTSQMGGKYVAGVSTANGENAARKTAKGIVQMYAVGFFKRTYITGTMGVGTMNKGVRTNAWENAAAMGEAKALGAKVAEDIRSQNAYPMQNLLVRLFVRLKLRPFIARYILANKDGREKAVFENLKLRGLI